MPKIKLTKGELKRQRQALGQYQRYLPTLQLKKQQLQLEIQHELILLSQTKQAESAKVKNIETWAGLLSEESSKEVKSWLKPQKVETDTKNIAGVDIPVFKGIEFSLAEYDLFDAPLWIDAAIDSLRGVIAVRREIETIEKGIAILRRELRITTQRVNLFEKIKIPEAEEAIRRIKIYIGDQMANAVGRSKIAKRKIEEYILEALPV